MYFAVPEGTTRLSVQNQQFDVEHGVVDVPEAMLPHMLAHGCKPCSARAVTIVVNQGESAAEIAADAEQARTGKKK
jgi:hypothetical protein